MTSVSDSWTRIEQWLAKHAPRSFGALRPGATASAIAEAERVLGVRLPADVAESARRHDGGEDFLLPGGYGLMPLAAIVARWAELDAVRVREGFGDGWFQPDWIPLADNGAADLIVADGVTGRVGMFVHDDPSLFEAEPPLFDDFPSFAGLLLATADSLEGGSPVAFTVPFVAERRLAWAYELPPPAAGATSGRDAQLP